MGWDTNEMTPIKKWLFKQIKSKGADETSGLGLLVDAEEQFRVTTGSPVEDWRAW